MTDKSDERKAVPREPTQEMMNAIRHYFETPRIKAEIWQTMYDAAPVLATAPAEPPKDTAALIERMNAARDSLRQAGFDIKDSDPSLYSMYLEAMAELCEANATIIALRARLSAPVPAQEWIPTEAKTPDDMLARDGLYAVSDTKTQNALVPIIVRNGDAYAVKLEPIPLCKWGWLETVVIYGGFVRPLSPPAADK